MKQAGTVTLTAEQYKSLHEIWCSFVGVVSLLGNCNSDAYFQVHKALRPIQDEFDNLFEKLIGAGAEKGGAE